MTYCNCWNVIRKTDRYGYVHWHQFWSVTFSHPWLWVNRIFVLGITPFKSKKNYANVTHLLPTVITIDLLWWLNRAADMEKEEGTSRGEREREKERERERERDEGRKSHNTEWITTLKSNWSMAECRRLCSLSDTIPYQPPHHILPRVDTILQWAVSLIYTSEDITFHGQSDSREKIPQVSGSLELHSPFYAVVPLLAARGTAFNISR